MCWCHYYIYSNNAQIMDHIMDIYRAAEFLILTFLRIVWKRWNIFTPFIACNGIHFLYKVNTYTTQYVYHVIYITIWEHVLETVLRSVGYVYGSYGTFFFETFLKSDYQNPAFGYLVAHPSLYLQCLSQSASSVLALRKFRITRDVCASYNKGHYCHIRPRPVFLLSANIQPIN